MEKSSTEQIVRHISIIGEEKKEILKKCQKIVSHWGLKLPRVDPDVLHFGLSNFYTIGEIEFDIVNDIPNCYCGKFIFMFKGQKCPKHYHRLKKETFFVVKGKIDMIVNTNRTVMRQGDRITVERRQKHEFVALEDSLILENSNPDLLLDSIFSDRKIRNTIFANANGKHLKIDEEALDDEISNIGLCSFFTTFGASKNSTSAGRESQKMKFRQ